MTERFEDILAQELSQLPPPESVVRDTNPWHRALEFILIGQVLTMLRMDLHCLDYLLPLIGYVYLLLGHRILWQENGALKAGWILTIIRASLFALKLCFDATFVSTQNTALSEIFGYIDLSLSLLGIVHVICLHYAAEALRERSSLPKQRWYGSILIGIALFPGLLIPEILVCIYVLLMLLTVNELLQLNRNLGDIGYAIEPVPVRLSNRTFTALTVGITVAAVITYGIAFRKAPMDFAPVQDGNAERVSATEAKLTELGVPSDIVADLSDEDVLRCEGAIQVQLENRQYTEDLDAQVTVIAVQVPTSGSFFVDRWVILNHFQFADTHHFTGTDAISTQQDLVDPIWWYVSRKDNTSGRVLYDRDGTTVESNFYSITYSLEYERLTQTAYFSFPDGAENYRGYLIYTTELTNEGCIFNTIATLTHQTMIPNYPAQVPAPNEDKITFRENQTQLQFYPGKND